MHPPYKRRQQRSTRALCFAHPRITHDSVAAVRMCCVDDDESVARVHKPFAAPLLRRCEFNYSLAARARARPAVIITTAALRVCPQRAVRNNNGDEFVVDVVDVVDGRVGRLRLYA